MQEKELAILDYQDYLAELQARRPKLAWLAENDSYFLAKRNLEAIDRETERVAAQLRGLEAA